MILTPPQNKIATDRHRFRVLRCGRRFGKTTLMTEEIKGVTIYKPSRAAYIATNYQQARDIAWEMLIKQLTGAIIQTNEARLEIKVRTVTGEESYISLRGWESIENLRGQAFDFLGVDEVASMRNFWMGWQEVLRPTLTDRRGQGFFSSTPKGFNHFYDLCNRELTDAEFKTFHYTSYDNPFLPVDEIEKAKQTLPPEVFSQEYLAEFQKTQGLVYKEFDRRRHLYDFLPNLPAGKFERIAPVDFGYRNPAAVLHIYSDGEMFYVEDEWYKKERTDAQIAEYVAACRFNSVFPDPENPGGIEELRRRGQNVREVAKGRGSIAAGIQKVREMLISGKIKVNKKCVNLISEFEMYSYDDEEHDRNEKEEPVRAFNHALDALRYAATTYKTGGQIMENQKRKFEITKSRLTQSTR